MLKVTKEELYSRYDVAMVLEYEVFPNTTFKLVVDYIDIVYKILQVFNGVELDYE